MVDDPIRIPLGGFVEIKNIGDYEVKTTPTSSECYGRISFTLVYVRTVYGVLETPISSAAFKSSLIRDEIITA
jgi:hypothetical protein